MYEDSYQQFLLDLDAQKNKEIYARITALTFAELPVETIEGRVTGGSINIDGASAIRRSCSLTISAQDFTYNYYYWGLNSKFKLEIGVKNTINSSMPEIIWFNQGLYLITTFNTSHNTNTYTISISGKDKMCLLNGEVGGTLESSVDFGTIEEEDNDGVWKISKIPIFEIIRNMVHTYAGEPYHNIIINDLDTYGLELLEYRYDVPMYLYRKNTENTYYNMIMENDDLILYLDKERTMPVKLKDIDSEYLDILVEPPGGISHTPKPLYFKSSVNSSSTPYIFAKIEYGQTAGYRISDLIYPGDLVANPGESITSILDKIKSMLTEFEYFYDLDGHFVFQKKKSFISTMWSPLHNDENNQDSIQQSLALSTATAYSFNNNQGITAFNNNPNLLNLRNDYSIWGERTGTSGAKLPIHMRYAIDKKPQYYKNFNNEIFVTGKDVFKNIEYSTTQEIFKEYFEQIKAFTPKYPQPDELRAPTKRADGSWTAGWWDIRDWAEYYKILTATTEEPPYTMKWYSTGDDTGCEYLTLKALDGNLQMGRWCWLLIRKKSKVTNDYYYVVSHGASTSLGGATTCTLYRSYYDTNGVLKTVKALDENGNDITKVFGAPYSGCTDTHTYLKFLTEDTNEEEDSSVYFYNPAFPTYDSYEDLVTEVATKYYEEQGLLHYVDWREIIYQMSLDYYAHNTEDNFELQIIRNNPSFYPSGQTGYERYYIDLSGFWRQIYYPFLNELIAETEKEKNETSALIESSKQAIEAFKETISELNDIETPTEEQTIQLIDTVDKLEIEEDKLRKLEIALDGIKNRLDKYNKLIPDYYYYPDDLFTNTEEEVELIYKGVVNSYLELIEKTGVQLGHYYLLTDESTYNEITYHVGDVFVAVAVDETTGIATWENGLRQDEKQFWLKDVYEHPESLNFWFDFLDTEGELQQFNVKNIGSRSKTVNETSIKSIYFRRTPAVVFTSDINSENRISSYKYLQIPEQYIEQMFTTSSQGKSAKDRLDELLYAHGYCIETVTITALPIYYLDVNTRIYVHDNNTNIDGDYVISKLTIPLTYNGTMSINATKAAENILN